MKRKAQNSNKQGLLLTYWMWKQVVKEVSGYEELERRVNQTSTAEKYFLHYCREQKSGQIDLPLKSF